MTEEVTKPASKSVVKDEVKRFIGIDKSTGQVESKRYHNYSECSFISDRNADELSTVNEREIRLLGLKACVVCEKRLTGGPSIEALTAVIVTLSTENSFNGSMDSSSLAWKIVEMLKSHNVYLATRKKAD